MRAYPLFKAVLILLSAAALNATAQAPPGSKNAAAAASDKVAPVAVDAQAGGATLVIKPGAGFIVRGGRFFDKSSMDSNYATYDLGVSTTATVQLGPPKDTPANYNLAALQINVAGSPGCVGQEEQVVACYSGRVCNLSQSCRPGGRWSISSQGDCNGGIAPASGRIELSLSCGGSDDPFERTMCRCKVTVGTPTKTKAQTMCPYSCQSYNPSSKSCVGAPMNGC